MKRVAGKLFQDAEADLAALGWRVNAMVEYCVKGPRAGYYVIAQINWGVLPAAPHLWFYGRKVRRDGTLGTAWHSLADIARLRLVDPFAEDHADAA